MSFTLQSPGPELQRAFTVAPIGDSVYLRIGPNFFNRLEANIPEMKTSLQEIWGLEQMTILIMPEPAGGPEISLSQQPRIREIVEACQACGPKKVEVSDEYEVKG